MSIAREWTSHLKTEKEKQEFTKMVLHDGMVLDQLERIVSDLENAIREKEIHEDFSSPSWPYLQADRLGQLKSLATMRRILKRK